MKTLPANRDFGAVTPPSIYCFLGVFLADDIYEPLFDV